MSNVLMLSAIVMLVLLFFKVPVFIADEGCKQPSERQIPDIPLLH